MSHLIGLSQEDGHARVSFQRAHRRNALTHALADEFEVVVDGLVADGTSLAVLAADPPVFSSGADTEEMGRFPDNPASERIIRRLLSDPILWICRVDGPALGAGIGIVAVCPIVVCSTDCWFSMPEQSLGFFPTGVMAYLETAIGSRRALTLGLTGERFSAKEAVGLGLATEAVPADDVDTRVTWWVERLAAQPSVAATARLAWQSSYRQPHARGRKRELDRMLDLSG